MRDLWYYARLECCILGSAVGLLSDAGLPVPARQEGVFTGVKGNPACCDSLLVTPARSLPNPGNTVCGPRDRIAEWEIRVFRDVCQSEPECGEDPVDCFDAIPCPGEPWPDQVPDDCAPLGKSWARWLSYADRAVLEAGLPEQVDQCLCNDLFGCHDPGCGLTCSQPTEWVSTDPVTGGGCAGWLIRIRTHTLGVEGVPAPGPEPINP